MLPKPLPELKGEDARRFIEDDKKPLSNEEKEAIAQSIKTYHNIKHRSKKK